MMMMMTIMMERWKMLSLLGLMMMMMACPTIEAVEEPPGGFTSQGELPQLGKSECVVMILIL
jgi:hypothetical protein